MKLSPRATAFGIAAAVWITLTAFYIMTGFQPDDWYSSRGIAPQHQSYPIDLVLTFSLISAGEIVVFLLLARPWYFHDLPWRLLVTFILFSLWTILWVLAQLHQPPVNGAHVVSLLTLVPILLVALICVSIVTWVRHRGIRLVIERPSATTVRQPRAEPPVIATAHTKSVVVGDECDEGVVELIRTVLTSLNLVRNGCTTVMGGSQEIDTYRFTLNGAGFEITFETYAGITITGEPAAVDRVIEVIARKHKAFTPG